MSMVITSEIIDWISEEKQHKLQAQKWLEVAGACNTTTSFPH